MNARTFSAKRLLLAAFVFLGLGLAAQAQIGSIPALTADYQVPGSTITANSRNTGTDALILNAGPYTGQNLQVMTWEAPSGPNTIALSWSVQNGTAPPSTAGIQTITRTTSALGDPDIVVAQNEAGVWVNLVYTQRGGNKNDRRTMYEVYKWNGAGFTQVGSTLPLGDPIYDHLSPNIDANAEGLVGIVWQQQRTVTAQVSVTSPLAEFSPFGYTQTYTFDRSYLVTGNITGGLNFCNYNNGAAGAPVANPSQLVEQTLQPDVAVSRGDNANAIVSVSYVRHYVNNDALSPAYGIRDELVVRQFAYGVCVGGEINPALVPIGTPSSFSWTLPGLNGDLAPRIAASNSKFRDDVEVALAWIPGIGCGGGAPTYDIRNYGKSQGVFRANAVTVGQPFSPPAVGSLIDSRQPAISYVGGTDGYYAITWAGKNYPASPAITGIPGSPATPAGNDYDVFGVTMQGGQFLNSSGTLQPTPFRYSFVNQKVFSAQRTPSVAGRYLYKNGTVHLFNDGNANNMSFKASGGTGGSTPYRQAAPGGGTQPKVLDMGSKAYPNPADGTVYLQVPLREGERVKQVLVTDAMGRTVDRLPVAADADGSGAALTWKPAAQLPAGGYFFKLTTTQRSESIPVHRN